MCKSKDHTVYNDNIMIKMEGKFEAASKFIYAIRSYILNKYDEAKIYAKAAICAGSKFNDNLNGFVNALSTLIVIILSEFEINTSLKKLVELANSIPLIPLVWITFIEHWRKLENVEINNKHYILKLLYWDNDIPKNNTEVLRKLTEIKNHVCGSNYLKEVLLNTCGFATEWVPLIWKLDKLELFLFTITELKSLANKIGPLEYILRPISTNEVYKIMNDFISETSNEKLDRSGVCASWSLCLNNK